MLSINIHLTKNKSHISPQSNHEASLCWDGPWIPFSTQRFHCVPGRRVVNSTIKYNARAYVMKRSAQLKPHHVLAPLHELFVDDLAGIVFPGLDVDGLLHDSVCATAERLACAVLRVCRESKQQRISNRIIPPARPTRTWQGTVVAGDIADDPERVEGVEVEELADALRRGALLRCRFAPFDESCSALLTPTLPFMAVSGAGTTSNLGAVPSDTPATPALAVPTPFP